MSDVRSQVVMPEAPGAETRGTDAPTAQAAGPEPIRPMLPGPVTPCASPPIIPVPPGFDSLCSQVLALSSIFIFFFHYKHRFRNGSAHWVSLPKNRMRNSQPGEKVQILLPRRGQRHVVSAVFQARRDHPVPVERLQDPGWLGVDTRGEKPVTRHPVDLKRYHTQKHVCLDPPIHAVRVISLTRAPPRGSSFCSGTTRAAA
jgi:hypothetical protein